MGGLRNVPKTLARKASTAASPSITKPAGDISSVFPSLSGKKAEPLPNRFKDLKVQLARGQEQEISDSWFRLLDTLRDEIRKIKKLGSDAIPTIDYNQVKSGSLSEHQLAEIRHRGSVVIKNVIPRSEALELKARAREYISANQDRVKAFPADSPAVYELYWSPNQVEARAHPDMLKTQKFLTKLWHSSDPKTQISTTHPLTYADRFRIRSPGDAQFALGPHSDGGSLEKWEDPEYSRVFQKIIEGRWEEYDPFDAKHRVNARMDMYNGAGACSMLRFFQGWLSMSDTGPGEGTLKLCPLLKHATAYVILRPFMSTSSIENMDTAFPGSVPAACQEYNDETHPDLDLSSTMVSVPRVEPGDYVAWHCDTIHAVDKEHRGLSDSSVMYIPSCPMTPASVDFLVRQRQAASAYSPPPDFPGAGGPGEMGFTGAFDWNRLNAEGLQAMGMGKKKWETPAGISEGEKSIIDAANRVCFG